MEQFFYIIIFFSNAHGLLMSSTSWFLFFAHCSCAFPPRDHEHISIARERERKFFFGENIFHTHIGHQNTLTADNLVFSRKLLIIVTHIATTPQFKFACACSWCGIKISRGKLLTILPKVSSTTFESSLGNCQVQQFVTLRRSLDDSWKKLSRQWNLFSAIMKWLVNVWSKLLSKRIRTFK